MTDRPREMTSAIEADDRLDQYNYVLPKDRIAAEPATRRDASRLLVVDRHRLDVEHGQFSRLSSYLSVGDLLVVNDARVIPARLRALRTTGGEVEVVLHPTGLEAPMIGGRRQALALLKPSARIKAGEELRTAHGLSLRVEDPPGAEIRRVSFTADLEQFLEHGLLPLPPYLPRPPFAEMPFDRDRYQTIFADRPGAIAAPTAGLHFTSDLIDRLQGQGIEIARITLHVGPGTFLPVRTRRLSEHSMQEEAYEIPLCTVQSIERAKSRRRRVVAVGTTTTRALESAALQGGVPTAGKGRTRLMIRPPFDFRCVDALITNFHLPRSTLLALVAAFAGRARVLDWYRTAVDQGYRFYSYGDAMLIL